MADGLNRAQLLGNLGADPELRFTTAGKAVLNMRIATSETWLDENKERKERTEWHAVVVWGKRAEALAKILRKGSSIYVEGQLRTTEYEDKEKNKRRKTEIVASNVLLTGGKPGAAADAGPAKGGAPARTVEPDPGYPTGGDDDIPF